MSWAKRADAVTSINDGLGSARRSLGAIIRSRKAVADPVRRTQAWRDLLRYYKLSKTLAWRSGAVSCPVDVRVDAEPRDYDDLIQELIEAENLFTFEVRRGMEHH